MRGDQPMPQLKDPMAVALQQRKEQGKFAEFTLMDGTEIHAPIDVVTDEVVVLSGDIYRISAIMHMPTT